MGEKAKITFVETRKDAGENDTKKKDFHIIQLHPALLTGVHMADWHLCRRHKSLLAQISFSCEIYGAMRLLSKVKLRMGFGNGWGDV